MPDNTHILFPKRNQELWMVNVQNGIQKKIDLTLDYLCHAVIHPDGKKIALVTLQENHELWVMENFLTEMNRDNDSPVN